MDDEAGLINMNARIYDPYLGRFLSADPVLPDAGDMQAYNRYSYVINNPLRYTDPTGNEYEDDRSCFDDSVCNDDEEGDLDPQKPEECSRVGYACEADRNGYDDRDEARDRYEEYFEISLGDNEADKDDEVDVGLEFNLTLGGIKDGACRTNVCFTGLGSEDPATLSKWKVNFIRFAATKEGTGLLSSFFSRRNGGQQRVLEIHLFYGQVKTPSTAEGSKVNINLTTVTNGSPNQRLYSGENGTLVGSELRTLAHEIYHAAFFDRTLAKLEITAVKSANRVIAQDASLLGRPERAGVRTSYDRGKLRRNVSKDKDIRD